MDIGDIVYYYVHWSDSIVKSKIEKISLDPINVEPLQDVIKSITH